MDDNLGLAFGQTKILHPSLIDWKSNLPFHVHLENSCYAGV